MPLFLLILIIFIIVYAVRSRKRKKRNALVLADPAYSVAKTAGYRSADRYGGTWIKYEFTVNNVLYWSEKKLHGTRHHDYLKNCTFPVIYCKSNPGLNSLLVIEKDFKLFNLVQPENLKVYNKNIV